VVKDRERRFKQCGHIRKNEKEVQTSKGLTGILRIYREGKQGKKLRYALMMTEEVILVKLWSDQSELAE
jgi:hypothetical protein